jgi:hypothetical protein
MEWPTLIFGVLFVLGAGWMLYIGPVLYGAQRQQPRWTLPVSRLWPSRYDVLVTRLVAGAIAIFGVVLIAAAIWSA